MPRAPIVAVDFDGVIAQYDGWKGQGVYGEPMAGAVRALQKLAAEGWEIIIWTCRNLEERPTLAAYLDRYGIPYSQINDHSNTFSKPTPKVYADVYIDDRAWRFDPTRPDEEWKKTMAFLAEVAEGIGDEF